MTSKIKCPACGSIDNEVDWYKLAVEKLGWHEVTVWCRKDPSGSWSHNHIEFGHVKNDVPIGKYPHQTKVWEGQKWTKIFCYGDAHMWPMPLLTK